ncbi:hypothetical protein D4R75_02445 [bacterium]|nr:MAG: hypothetical protein D4R75_02445 [bacterium]
MPREGLEYVVLHGLPFVRQIHSPHLAGESRLIRAVGSGKPKLKRRILGQVEEILEMTDVGKLSIFPSNQ